MDVPVGGTITEATAKFKEKGFTITSKDDGYVAMEGKMGSITIELDIVATPITKTVWKFAVYLPKQTNWYSIKNEFYEYRKTLMSKYGEPTKDYNFFSNPYYEGDGYEMSAISLDKCSYLSFWDEQSVSIYISKFKQVCITYESKTNSALDDEEKEKVKTKSF